MVKISLSKRMESRTGLNNVRLKTVLQNYQICFSLGANHKWKCGIHQIFYDKVTAYKLASLK